MKTDKGTTDNHQHFDLGLKHKYLYFGRTKSIAFAESFMKGLKPAGSGDYLLMVRGIGYKRNDIQSITVHQMS